MGQLVVTRDEAFAVIAKLRAGQSDMVAEARRLGCHWTQLKAACVSAVGIAEFRRISKLRDRSANIGDPRRCPDCRSKLIQGTSGGGLAVLLCTCGFRDVVAPRQPTKAERESAGHGDVTPADRLLNFIARGGRPKAGLKD